MSLPNWFILQSPPNLNIEIREWKQLALHRVKLLENLPSNPSQVIRDYFPTHEDSLDETYEQYRLGAYLLRLVAATNRSLEAWLIESEGDLFERLYFDRTTPDQKRAIFRRVFGEQNVMEYEEFKNSKDESKNVILAKLYNDYIAGLRRGASRDFLICIHFSQVPWMISNRKGYLRKGWVVSNENSFRGSLKKAFEKSLQVEIERNQNLLGVREEIDEAVQELEQQLAKHTQIRSRFSSDDLEGSLLHNHPEIFPPCMIYISTELESTRRLTHTKRLQLGFFLKRVGMSVDEQLNYWFEKSIDNVNISYNEFLRTSGYQIRHLYGLEGGKKDYNVPKCSTIATSYFCPFIHLDPESLHEFLTENHLTKAHSVEISPTLIDRLVEESSKDPTSCCTKYFSYIYNRTPYRKIVHPLQWVRISSKIIGIYNVGNQEPKEETKGETQ